MNQRFMAYHVGVEGKLAPKLNAQFKANAAALASAGIAVPDPKKYRPFLRDYVWNTGTDPNDQMHAIDAFGVDQGYLGVTMSNNQALSAKQTLFDKGEFLFWAESRVKRLGALFSDHRLMFMLEIENFATFLPRVAPLQQDGTLDGISDWKVEDFSWADLIAGLSASCPEAEIVIVPTEVLDTTFDAAATKLTMGAAAPKPSAPATVNRARIDAFQRALGAAVAQPLDPAAAAMLGDTLNWDDDMRIDLTRKYYSEALALFQEHTVLL